jgi:hypothetical protein
MQNLLTNSSPKEKVLRTVCEKCGSKGYIFHDQLKPGEKVKVGEAWYAKCCGGRRRMEKRARAVGFIDTGRACRLHNIRRRETNINPEDAVANF